MAKFDIKTVKPKFVVTTGPDNKIDVVVNKPIITSKNTKSFFQLKNTGGPKGVKGDKGEPGQDATIEVASTTTGAAGTNASVVNQGTASAAQLAFTIPRGDKGDKGDDGAAGYSPTATVSKSGDTATITITDKNGTTTASISDGQDGAAGAPGQDGQSATIEVASTSTLPAGSSATVTNVGTQSAARLAFGIPKGDTGAAGADGDAATITVGQVETLQPNQSAYVTNVGTTSQAIFNIGIPKGEKGDSGSGSGDMTASTYDPNGTVAAAGGIPDYVDSNGGKIDTIEVNGTPQTITNKTVDISVPTKTSDLTNDGSDNTSTYVEADDYASASTAGVIKTTNAFGVDMSNSGEIKGTIVSSANYDSMWNDAIVSKGTLENALSTKGYATTSQLPTVNDATLTIQKNGTTVQTFTANQGTNATADITVPTKTSDITNDSGYITSSSLPGDMTGATGSTAGAHGLVPAPAAGDQDKVLKGDGTWGDAAATAIVAYINGAYGGSWTSSFQVYTTSAYTTVCPFQDIDDSIKAGVAVIFRTTDNYDITITGLLGTVSTTHYYTALYDSYTLGTLAYSESNSRWAYTAGTPINDATLTIQKNGTTVQTFTANQSTNATANITVPTQLSDLSGTISTSQIADAAVTDAKIDWSTVKRFVRIQGNASSFTTDVYILSGQSGGFLHQLLVWTQTPQSINLFACSFTQNAGGAGGIQANMNGSGNLSISSLVLNSYSGNKANITINFNLTVYGGVSIVSLG